MAEISNNLINKVFTPAKEKTIKTINYRQLRIVSQVFIDNYNDAQQTETAIREKQKENKKLRKTLRGMKNYSRKFNIENYNGEEYKDYYSDYTSTLKDLQELRKKFSSFIEAFITYMNAVNTILGMEIKYTFVNDEGQIYTTNILNLKNNFSISETKSGGIQIKLNMTQNKIDDLINQHQAQLVNLEMDSTTQKIVNTYKEALNRRQNYGSRTYRLMWKNEDKNIVNNVTLTGKDYQGGKRGLENQKWLAMKIQNVGAIREAYVALLNNPEIFKDFNNMENQIGFFALNYIRNVDNLGELYGADIQSGNFGLAVKSFNADLPGYQQYVNFAKSIVNLTDEKIKEEVDKLLSKEKGDIQYFLVKAGNSKGEQALKDIIGKS